MEDLVVAADSGLLASAPDAAEVEVVVVSVPSPAARVTKGLALWGGSEDVETVL